MSQFLPTTSLIERSNQNTLLLLSRREGVNPSWCAQHLAFHMRSVKMLCKRRLATSC